MPRGHAVSLYIDIDLYKRARRQVKRSGYRSLSELVNELLREWLEREREKEKERSEREEPDILEEILGLR